MSILAAIAVFPAVTLVLIGLSKAENGLRAGETVAAPSVAAEPPPAVN